MNFLIIQKSQLEDAQRFDPEYFTVAQISGDYFLGDQIVDFVQYGTSDDLNEERIGYPTLRLNEFESCFIKSPEKFCNKISESQFNNLKLQKNDILICRTNGNPQLVGKSAIVMEDAPYAFASYLFRIRVKKEMITPSTLISYLYTSYGRSEIEKNMMTSNQTNFSPARFKLIRVPKFKKSLQDTVDKLMLEAYISSETSKDFYKKAEEMLLKESGLRDFQEENDLSCVVNFSEVQNANRIDAEYFQTKYERLIEKVKFRNAKLLGELVSVRKGLEPGSEAYQEEGKLFIRVSSLSKFGIDNVDQKYLSDKLYEKLQKDFQPQIGEILLTKDATPGIAFVIKDSIEGIISGGILRLKIKSEIEPEYLALCINSIVGKWQAERDAGGSIIAHWKVEQVKNLLIPVLPMEKQKEIAELVKKSHEARKESKELLEEAKRKVEEMIEKGGDN